MDLFEYQAKQVFQKYGVPVSLGEVATTPDEAKAIAEKLGGVTVVKAQVKIGGRGKAGGVKVAKTPNDAKANAEQILGMDIKGHTVHRVMVAQGAKIAEEYYFSVLLDRGRELDAAGLAAAADLHLGLDHDLATTLGQQPLGGGPRLLRRLGDGAAQDGHAVLLEEVARLVLEEVHGSVLALGSIGVGRPRA